MQDYYQVLGIAPDASAQVVRIAFEGRMKALSDPAAAASPAERRDAERLLKEAFVTLSAPAKRGPYDEKLREESASTAGEPAPRRGRIVASVAAAGVAIAALAFSLGQSRDDERLRLESERLAKQRATQNAKLKAQAQLEAARAREVQAHEEEMAELKRMAGGRGLQAAEDPAIAEMRAEARREEARRSIEASQLANERARQFREDLIRNRMAEREAIERDKRQEREARRR